MGAYSQTLSPPVEMSAVQTDQSGRRVFIGALRAADLLEVTTIDRYNPELSPTDPDQGYQRPPERSRITRIGRYLIESEQDALFPNPVLLAARKPLRYDAKQQCLTLARDELLQIIDGQHRMEGLRYAIQEKSANNLEGFMLPVVIIETPERDVEMEQFATINGTAKSVKTDLVRAIQTAKAAARGEETIEPRDRWGIVVTKVVDRLDKDPQSPWYDLIALPGAAPGKGAGPRSKGGKVVAATSFMTSLRPVYNYLENNPRFHTYGPTTDAEATFLTEIVGAYWHALHDVVPEAFAEPQNYVIQKTPGLFSLHKLLPFLLDRIYWGPQFKGQWTAPDFIPYLEASEHIPTASFWNKEEDGAAVYGSMKGFTDLYHLLRTSIESGR